MNPEVPVVAVKDIDEYISTFPENVQEILQKVRQIFQEAAPEAEESISYHMPTFKLNGNPLVYFAAFKSHVGIYALSADSEALKRELARYLGPKGSIRLPFEGDIPYDLVKKAIDLKVKDRREAAASAE